MYIVKTIEFFFSHSVKKFASRLTRKMDFVDWFDFDPLSERQTIVDNMNWDEIPVENIEPIPHILRNLYGLKSGASSWWIHFASTLRDLGFTSSTADDNVWIKPRYNDQRKLYGYDYIIVHVDDFMILVKDAESYMVKLQQLYKIRHVTPITESSTVYLEMDIRRMPHGKRGFLLSAHTYYPRRVHFSTTIHKTT